MGMRKQLNTYDYQVQRALKRKLYLIDLRGGKCEKEKCGYNKNLAAFDFHHKDPSIKESPLDSRTLSNSTMEWILKEFEKCLVVCANCHREEHHPNLELEKVRKQIKNYDDVLIVRTINKPHCVDCGTEINYTHIRCIKCNSIHKRKVKWPKLDTLINEKNVNGTEWCAIKYNVSSKTIRRWIKKIPHFQGS